jgi:hypothetical protein
MVPDRLGQFLVRIVSTHDLPPLVKAVGPPLVLAARYSRGRATPRRDRCVPRSYNWDKDAALAPRRRPSPHARTVLLSGGPAISTTLFVHVISLAKRLPRWFC